MSDRIAYSAEAVRALESVLMQCEGIGSNTLMERAGAAAFTRARRQFPDARRWVVMAGTGNNAGDGYVVARLARQEGIDVTVLLLSPDMRPEGDAATQYDAMQEAGVPVGPFGRNGIPQCDLVVDAMLGIGLSRPLKGLYLDAVRTINRLEAPVMAVDIPTGIHADNGTCMGAAVRAELTVTFVADKTGLFLGDAPDYVGRRALEPLGGISGEGLREVRTRFADQAALRVFGENTMRRMLPSRRRADHKGRFGHVLLVAGGPGMGGAARLAGEGALRAGAGLVSVATHPEHSAAVLSGRPELMVQGVRNAEELAPLLERATIVAVGCGLGRDAWARDLFRSACASELPCVVDADGLGLLAEFSDSEPSGGNAARRIMTPHPGEAGRMLGRSSAQVQADRLAAVTALQRRYGGVALLKGAHTLVAGGDRSPWVIDAGNPGMATAGMGDVLTGLLAGLWAQFPDADSQDLAALAAFVHAQAGDSASRGGQRGMIAGDLLAALRQELNP